MPHYRRAAMDGFAVMASETLGAGTGSPVMLRLADIIGVRHLHEGAYRLTDAGKVGCGRHDGRYGIKRK